MTGKNQTSTLAVGSTAKVPSPGSSHDANPQGTTDVFKSS